MKIPIRHSAIPIFENNDEFCFTWSILAHLHPIADYKTGLLTRVSSYRQYFDKPDFQGINFSNG